MRARQKARQTHHLKARRTAKRKARPKPTAAKLKKKREEKEVLLKVEYFKPSGELIYSQNREYVKDKNGVIWFLKSTITGDPEKSKVSSKRGASRYEWDADFKHGKYYNDKNEMSSESFYNDNGYIVKELSYSKGRVDEVYLYEYDSDGNTIKETFYAGTEDNYGSVRVTKYSYKGGKIISEDTETKHSNGNTAIAKRTYKYDSKGNEIKTVDTWANGTKTVCTKTFDDHNNCTFKRTENIVNGKSEKSNFDFRYKYTYDGDNYVKVSFSEFPSKQSSGEKYWPVTKETYKGDKIIEEVIYSWEDAMKGKYKVPDEIIKYTYGKV